MPATVSSNFGVVSGIVALTVHFNAFHNCVAYNMDNLFQYYEIISQFTQKQFKTVSTLAFVVLVFSNKLTVVPCIHACVMAS